MPETAQPNAEQPQPKPQTTVIDRTEDEDGNFTVTFTLHPRKP